MEAVALALVQRIQEEPTVLAVKWARPGHRVASTVTWNAGLPALPMLVRVLYRARRSDRRRAARKRSTARNRMRRAARMRLLCVRFYSIAFAMLAIH